MARAELERVRWLLVAGRDPSRALAETRALMDRAARLQPSFLGVPFDGVNAACYDAQHRLRSGGDPEPALAAGRRARAELLRLRPDCALCLVKAAQLALVDDDAAARSGRARRPRLTEAVGYARRALAINAKLQVAQLTLARAELRLGELEAGRHQKDALALIDGVLAINYGDAEAHALRARARLAETHAATGGEARAAALAAARAEWARAQALDAWVEGDWGAPAELAAK
jgi:hypothetical protein